MKQQVTPQAIQAVAAQLGEDRERTASAVSTSVPSVLAALSDVAETESGAAHLKAAIEAKASPASRSATMSLLGGGGTGRDDALLDEELGRRSWTISDDVARSSGIGRESAHKLLGGVTSVALLALAKTGTPTNPQALRALLRQQSMRGETMYTAPEHAAAGAHVGPAIRQLESPRRSWWLVAAGLVLAALIAIPLIRGIMRTRQTPTMAPVPTETAPAPQATAPEPAPQAAAPTPAPATEPAPAQEPQAAAPAEEPQAAAPAEEPQAAAPADEAAATPAFPAGSPVSELAAFLASDEGSTPRTFTLSPLNFDTGAIDPTADSTETVNELAEVLRAYPSAEITLDSHTDSTGSTAANEALADARSDSVKAMLVERDIDESRISTTGHGQNSPLDTNATSEGRAGNRRTDVIVTSR